MTKFEDNISPYLSFVEGTEPSAPAAGNQKIYIDSTTHHLSRTNSSGTERDLELGTFHGCKAIPSAGTTMTTGSTEYPIAFAGVDVYDTDAYHNPASTNTRLTIPSGLAGYYVFTGFVYIPVTFNAVNWIDLKIRLNGAAGTVLIQVRHSIAGDGNPIEQVVSPPVAVVATDYVELYAMTNVAGRTSDATSAFLSCHLIGV